MKLLVTAEGDWQEGWLASKPFDSTELEVMLLRTAGSPAPAGVPCRLIPSEAIADGSVESVPDLAALVEAFREFSPHACLVTDSGFFSQLVRVAARERRVPVFRLVCESGELAHAWGGERDDLDFRFLADSTLLDRALLDDRYGTALFLTGHPAKDVALQSGSADGNWGAERFGDGKATERIVHLIDRWRRGVLGPSRPDLSVIVPAYREAANLPAVCDRLLDVLEGQTFSSEILLVDDASPDETHAVAVRQMYRSPRIRAFSKPTPRGMGNAIRYGLDRARADIVAITMGDGSDEVSRIPAMFRKVHDEGYGLAIGSRYRFRQNYQAVPRLYRFWSACFRLTTRLLIGLPLTDYTNAFRAFHRRIFARYGPEGGGFEISPEITFKAWFATHRVAEVDVKHLKRASGQSNFSFLRAGPGYGKILLKAFVNRLTGRWFTLDW